MKLIDAFIFYNEEKMLDFRLNYYKDIVDYFVIVEATKTFSGLDKPLYFNRIKDKYKDKFKDTIIHYIVDEFPPDISTAWDREHYQRECIHKALLKIPKLRNDDWVQISDVDEISNRGKLQIILTDKNYSSPDKIGYTLQFDLYTYNLTTKVNRYWYQPKLLRYGELKNKVIKEIRITMPYPVLREFGWHFTYFFSPEKIKNKIESFSHQEYNKEEFTNKDHIEDCIKNRKSLFRLELNPKNTEKLEYIPLEENKNLPEDYHLLIE